MKTCPRQHPMEGPDADVRVRSDRRRANGEPYIWSECRRCVREKRAESRTGTVQSSNRARPNLTETDREWVRTYLDSGFSPEQVAEQCGIGISTVYKIRAEARRQAAS